MGLAERVFGRKFRTPKNVYQWKRLLAESAQPMAVRVPVVRRHDLQEPTGPYAIRGIKASDLEWRTWNTLLKLGWDEADISYQVDILGGRMPGGQVLDFVVWRPESPAVIMVNGDYWHGRGLQQRQQAAINEAIVRSVWGSKLTYVTLWTGDLVSEELGYSTLLREIGRG